MRRYAPHNVELRRDRAPEIDVLGAPPEPSLNARSSEPGATRSGWHSGHQYVVRPPTTPRSSGVPQRGQCPSRRRSPITSPVWTPPCRIAERVAARSWRRSRSSSSSDSDPAGRRGESRARQSVSSASRLPTPAITRWSSSSRLERRRAAPDPRAERRARDLGGVGADVREVRRDERAAEPALVAQREPPAVGELEREAVPVARRRRLVDHDPARPSRGGGRAPARSSPPRGTCRAGGCAAAAARSAPPRSRPAGAGGRRRCRDRRRRRSRGRARGRSARGRARPRGARASGAEPRGAAAWRCAGTAGYAAAAFASMRSIASGASTCSITITAAPITPARSSSAERTIRSERVPSGTARW